MRHFIAYHNTEKMGERLHEGDAFLIYTKKPVDHLIGETVWVVTGENLSDRLYSLGSVFRVSQTGPAKEAEFTRYASGAGPTISPPIPIAKTASWFLELKRLTGNFGFGLTEIKDETVIDGLRQLLNIAGYEEPR
jgi:hypothetical protein